MVKRYQWEPDSFLPGYERLVMELPHVETVPGDPDRICATLVRPERGADFQPKPQAVLMVHGWNDYFFQTHVADWLGERGLDFYAIDLRRFGRNLHPDQYGGYISNLDDYEVELDLAVAEIRRHHRDIILIGHSLGGLIVSLYANRRPGKFKAVMLNSPWINLQASAALRVLASPMVFTMATVSPHRVLPIAQDSDLYARSVHKSLDGEWDFDLDVKRAHSQPIRGGWLAAVLNGHEQVSAGLDIDCPVLVMISARSSFPKKWGPDCLDRDIVLDVDRVADVAPKLGSNVTIVRIEDGLHDLTLSKPKVRSRVAYETTRWMQGYVPKLRG